MRSYDEIAAAVQANKIAKTAAPIVQNAALNSLPDSGDSVERTSQLEAAVRNAAQGVSLNSSDEIQAGLKTAVNFAIGKNANYEKELAAVRAREKLTRQEWPKTALASNIAGGLATTAIPILGAATGATKTAYILNSARQAAKGAALAGFFGSDGDIKSRVRGGAIGGAIGGTVGLVTGTLGAAGMAAANKQSAALSAAKAVGAGVDDTGEAYAKAVAKTAGQGGASVSSKQAKEGLAEFGEELLRKDPVTGRAYIKPGDSIHQIREKVTADLTEVNESIGGMLGRLDKMSPEPAVDAEKVFTVLQKELGKMRPDILDDSVEAMRKGAPIKGSILDNNPNSEAVEAAIAAKFRSFANQYIHPQFANGQKPRVTLDSLHHFRSQLADDIYGGEAPKSVVKALRRIERVLAEEVEKGVQQIGGRTEKAVFQQLNRKAVFLNLASGATKRSAKSADNLSSGATSAAIASGVGMLGFGALTANPALMAAGVATPISTALGAPPIISRSLPAMATIHNAVASGLSSPIAQGVGQAGQAATRASLQSLFRQ